MKAEDKPTVISLFAGCGGSSLGYRMAGYRELLAVEWDKAAVETFELNFPGVPTYSGDIHELSAEECMRLAGGIAPRELDVLDGSPPCQGFSTAGKRKLDDVRNTLFEEYVRLLGSLQPKVFVLENVAGLVKGHMKQIYLAMAKALRDCGYRVDGKVLNAMYFGVPQQRKRVIIIGVRNDLDIEPSHPKPMMRPLSANKTLAHGWGPRPKLAHPWRSGQLKRKNEQYANKWRDAHRPSPTVAAARPPLIMEGDIIRELSWSECAELQSYPREFIFPDPKTAQKQIGNSVPPLLMKAIAAHIKVHILDAGEKAVLDAT